MNKLLTILICGFFYVASTCAQITLHPQVLEFNVEEEAFYSSFNIGIVNNSNENIVFYWKFEEGEDKPEEWEISVKDFNICYPHGLYECYPYLANSISPGDSSFFSFSISTKQITGYSYGILSIYSDSLFTNKIASTISPINSVESISNDDLILYPNPARDQFFLQNDAEVKSIEIMNRKGQVIGREDHFSGQYHTIADLDSGFYFLALKTADNQLVEVRKLIKI